MASNNSFCSLGTLGQGHKSLNEALASSFNLKVGFYLPSILPGEQSNRAVDTECPFCILLAVWRSPSHGTALRGNLGSSQNLELGPSLKFLFVILPMQPGKPGKHLRFSNFKGFWQQRSESEGSWKTARSSVCLSKKIPPFGAVTQGAEGAEGTLRGVVSQEREVAEEGVCAG